MNRYTKHITPIILTVFLLTCFQSVAQKPTYSFHSKLNKDTILLGDQIELSITATLPESYTVQFPFFPDTLVKGIEVLGIPVIDTLRKRSGESEFTYRLRLTSFDEETYRIPGFKLPFTDGQVLDTAVSSPLWLTVISLQPDSTIVDIFDIKPPISEPITLAEVVPWVGGGLLMAGLIALLIFYLAKRKKNEPMFFSRKPIDPPHVVALRELDRIKEKKLWSTDNHKHYHTLLTDVIRVYIEGRFAVAAMEQTTDETIRGLKLGNSIDSKLINELNETLSLADLVKFARFTPTIPENEAGLNFGFRFVNNTKLEEVPEAKEELVLSDDTTAIASDEKLPVEPDKSNES